MGFLIVGFVRLKIEDCFLMIGELKLEIILFENRIFFGFRYEINDLFLDIFF